MKSEYTKALQNIGLSDIAITIYLYLVDVKKATVVTIARETGEKRTNIYNHLPELFEYNLIVESVESGKKYITAESIENALDVFMEKAELVDDIAAELEAIQEQHPVSGFVHDHGSDGYKRFCEELLLATERVCVFLHCDSIQENLSNAYIRNFLARKKQHNVAADILIAQSDALCGNDMVQYIVKNNSHDRVRVMPPDQPLAMSMAVTTTAVYMFAPKTEGYVIKLESPAFVEDMQKIFAYAWERSRVLI